MKNCVLVDCSPLFGRHYIIVIIFYNVIYSIFREKRLHQYSANFRFAFISTPMLHAFWPTTQ